MILQPKAHIIQQPAQLNAALNARAGIIGITAVSASTRAIRIRAAAFQTLPEHARQRMRRHTNAHAIRDISGIAAVKSASLRVNQAIRAAAFQTLPEYARQIVQQDIPAVAIRDISGTAASASTRVRHATTTRTRSVVQEQARQHIPATVNRDISGTAASASTRVRHATTT